MTGVQYAHDHIKDDNKKHIFIDEVTFTTIPRSHTHVKLRGDYDITSHRKVQKGSIKCIATIGYDEKFTMYTYKTSVNSARYKWYLENVIGSQDGHTLIADNLSVHWTNDVQKSITDVLHMKIQRIPPYSPDLNSIEHIFSQIKDNLYRYHFTTLKELETSIRCEFEKITTDECKKLALHQRNVCQDIIANGGPMMC